MATDQVRKLVTKNCNKRENHTFCVVDKKYYVVGEQDLWLPHSKIPGIWVLTSSLELVVKIVTDNKLHIIALEKMTCTQSVQRLFSAKYIYSQTIHKNLVSKVCYSSHLQRSFGSAGNSGYFDVMVVGGGIMGSSTAHWLTKARFKSICGMRPTRWPH